MKKFLFLIVSFLVIINCNAQISKIIGNSARNTITKAKIYDGKIYTCGINQSNPFLPYATFSSYDFSGNLLSNVQLDTSSIPLDFEIITDEPNNPAAGFIMVGKTEPSTSIFGSPINNASFISELDAVGAVLNTQIYDASARESFNSVVRTGFTPDINYYVAGYINDNNTTANTTDRGVVWRLGADRKVQNIWEYQQDTTLDSELGKKIINWQPNRLLLIGNRVDTKNIRYGVIYTINKIDGAVDQAIGLPINHLISDAFRLKSGDLLVSGIISGTSTSFLTKLDKTSFASKWSVYLNGLNSLQELGEDINGLIYALGKDATEYYIHSFKDTGTSVSLISSTTLANGDSGFEFGNLFVNPSINNLLYADARTVSNMNGYGNQDIMLGLYSLDLKTKCKTTKDFTTISTTIKPVNINILKSDLSIPISLPRKANNISYKSKEFCSITNDTLCSCNNLIIKPLPTTVPLDCKGLFSLDAGTCKISKVEVVITNGLATIISINQSSCTATSSTSNSISLGMPCSLISPLEINFSGSGIIQYNIVTTLSNGVTCIYKAETQCSSASCCNKITKSKQPKECCSKINIDGCEVKSINIQTPNGFISGIDLQNCTDPVVPINTNNFTITNCITPKEIIVCTNNNSTSSQMIVNYTVTFFNGEICSIKDTIKCTPVVNNDCCPKTTIKPCVCPDSPAFITYNFSSTIVAPVCKVELNTLPSVSFLPSNVTVNGINDGSFVSNIHNFSTAGVTGNVSFSAAVAIGTSTTFIVTYTLCNGSICKESFNIKPKLVGDIIVIEKEVLKDTLFAYPVIINANNAQSKERVKFISILLESSSKIKDLLFAINGTEHFSDKNNSIVAFSEAIQGSRSATFVLKNDVALNELKNGLKFSLVAKSGLVGIKYTLYNSEGALLYEAKLTNMSGTVISTQELKQNLNISISPNPVSDIANISLYSSKERTLSIDLLNINGSLIKTIEHSIIINKESKNTIIDVDSLPNGIYFIRFRDDKGQSFVEKINVIH